LSLHTPILDLSFFAHNFSQHSPPIIKHQQAAQCNCRIIMALLAMDSFFGRAFDATGSLLKLQCKSYFLLTFCESFISFSIVTILRRNRKMGLSLHHFVCNGKFFGGKVTSSGTMSNLLQFNRASYLFLFFCVSFISLAIVSIFVRSGVLTTTQRDQRQNTDYVDGTFLVQAILFILGRI
jgi:hypothetical protein